MMGRSSDITASGRRRLGRDVLAASPEAERAREFQQAGTSRDQADAGHGSAEKRAGKPGAGRGQEPREGIALPESGPWNDDQDEPRFDEVCREDETCQGADDQSPACERDSAMMREARSR
jgi:hypothetical protein